jgi:hypothetical protein
MITVNESDLDCLRCITWDLNGGKGGVTGAHGRPDKEAQTAEVEKAGPILPQGLLFIRVAATEILVLVAGRRALG